MSPLNTSPLYRPYETLPGLNMPGIPAVAPLPTGETDDTRHCRTLRRGRHRP
ncbi:MAG: hypothetical protein R2856_02440 [Caldilineaceae bacterium]